MDWSECSVGKGSSRGARYQMKGQAVLLVVVAALGVACGLAQPNGH